MCKGKSPFANVSPWPYQKEGHDHNILETLINGEDNLYLLNNLTLVYWCFVNLPELTPHPQHLNLSLTEGGN